MNSIQKELKGVIHVKAPYALSEAQEKTLTAYANKAFKVKGIPVKFEISDELISGFKLFYLHSSIREIDLALETILKESISKDSTKVVDGLKKKATQVDSVGYVTSVENTIAFASGLTNVAYGELVEFTDSKIRGMVLDLLEDGTGIIVLGDNTKIKAGEKIIATRKQISIEVSDALLGRHVGTLGESKDGRSIDHKDSRFMLLENMAPGVLTRESVNRPLQTGILAVDSIIPIGRGQRELIIGDRQTGKTAIAIDTIINQKDSDVICIYVAIGQKASKIAQIADILEKHGASEYTVILSENAADPASLQYLAPYAGAAISEFFLEQGKDVLIVYDDLTKHAWAYREISLLLKRPPGREAYPGDVFYLHSRLLERACQLNEDNGGGSITALPIIETQAGDVSAYIPTNVISITDGQIYLESNLFNAGIKPAINVGLSVSRVGGAAQLKSMKQVTGKLRLELAQHRELASFAQFSSDLDEATKKKLDRGERIIEVLKQAQYRPVPVAQQLCIQYAAINGYLDKMSVEEVDKWAQSYMKMLKVQYKPLLETVEKGDKLTDEVKKQIEDSIEASL